MKILHAFWLPETTDSFRQGGSFRLWAETLERTPASRGRGAPIHPFSLPREAWPAFLEALGAKPSASQLGDALDSCTIQLPSAPDAPLPSPQLAKYWPEAVDEAQTTLQPWRVDCQRLDHPVRQLREIHFLSFYRAEDIQPGSDFLFWYWFTQELKRLLVRDQYLPTLIYHQPPKPKGKRKLPPFELYGSWQWASAQYEQLIADAYDRMPVACACGPGKLAKGDGLLRHCAEVLLDRIVRQTPLPAMFAKRIDNSLLTACVDPEIRLRKSAELAKEGYLQWQQWRRRIVGSEQDVAFTLGFRLEEPPDGGQIDWALHFVAVPKDDPSQRLALSDYWSSTKKERERMRRQLGQDFETHLLLDLGLAARMVPKLWGGLDTAEPQSVALDLDEAFDFLKESAWVLEDAGFKIVVRLGGHPRGGGESRSACDPRPRSQRAGPRRVLTTSTSIT